MLSNYRQHVSERELQGIPPLPLTAEETQLPPDQRTAGLSGHQLVLPSLWHELVVKSKWTAEQLWQAMSFGPSKMLKVKEEAINIGSRRWLLFDPNRSWVPTIDYTTRPYCLNQPYLKKKINGKVLATGLKN